MRAGNDVKIFSILNSQKIFYKMVYISKVER